MAEWIRAAPVEDLMDEDVLALASGAGYAAALDDDGGPHAFAAACPRDGAALAGGLLEGGAIECPACETRFDLADGHADDGGAALTILPSRIAEGWLWIAVP